MTTVTQVKLINKLDSITQDLDKVSNESEKLQEDLNLLLAKIRLTHQKLQNIKAKLVGYEPD